MTIYRPTALLEWRFISPVSTPTTSAVDILTTIAGQVRASSQYWQILETPNTGSNSIVLQSLSSAVEQMYVVIANNVTASGAYRFPDTSATPQANLQVGICLGSGSFLGSQRVEPFSGSVSWSGYWHYGTTTSLSQSFILENDEALLLGLRETDQNYAALFGALIEANDTNIGENDRNFGMMTCGPSALSAAFLGSTSQFLGFSATVNSPHAGVWITRRGGSRTFVPVRHAVNYLFSNSSATTVNSGSLIGVPIYMCHASGSYMIGRLREIFATRDTTSLSSVNISGSTCGYFVSSRRNSETDTILLAPYSGSANLVSFV